ncbi:MAG: branched-chain amino acid ABC transporter permease, partial [Minwuiales bacterium]|nr:branched-chain amino acid ABC transporter permease [Minwuiales bacterium]
ICMEEGFRLVFGPYGNSFDLSPVDGSVRLGALSMQIVEAATIVAAFGLLGALAVFAGRTRLGVAWRATVTDPEMAQSFGIDTVKVRYLNFFIGSALAAVAGILVALLNNFVEPTMGSVPSYKMLAIIVLGGLGNVKGTLVASLALGVMESFGTIYAGHIMDRDAIAFLFLVAVLMVRPQGLFGKA